MEREPGFRYFLRDALLCTTASPKIVLQRLKFKGQKVIAVVEKERQVASLQLTKCITFFQEGGHRPDMEPLDRYLINKDPVGRCLKIDISQIYYIRHIRGKNISSFLYLNISREKEPLGR